MVDTHEEDPTIGDETSTGGFETSQEPLGQEPERPGLVLRSGDRVGAFVLGRKLGEGGMGVVFEAEQQSPIRRTVALKLVKPGMDSERVLARFDAERQALALMSHPNIARVFDAGMTPSAHPYFVMEYVTGQPLVDYCVEQGLSLRQRLKLFIDICRGVQHAHQKGVVHRDLKPSNILVQERDGEREVKIIDFGIARAIDPTADDATTMTEAGQIVGTPAYMSPEQATRGNIDIDTRTDVYSLGVVLYELVSEVLPFDFADARKMGFEEMLRRVREETPLSPSRRLTTLGATSGDHGASAERAITASGGFSRELDWITMRAMEKDRDRRYDSAADLARDVACFLSDEPVAAGPPSLSYRAGKFVRRHRLAVVFSALLVASLVAGVTSSTWGLVRATRAETLARYEAETSAEVIDFMVKLFRISDPGEARGNSVTAREILDQGVDAIQEDWTDRPDVRGRLLETMGLVYRSLGLYETAQPLLESAVDDYEASYGARSSQVADGLNSLAGLLLIQRRGSEALPFLERADSIQRERLDPADPKRGRTLNNLGLAARLSDRMEDALAYYEESLALRQAALGEEHVDLIRPLGNLGSLYRALEDDARALQYYERALGIAEAELADDHPDRARLLNNLATLHRTSGRPDEALAALTQVLEIRERVLGSDHPDLVPSLVNLGEVQLERGEPVRARAAFERAVEVGEGKLPEGHPLLSRAASRLAELDAGESP